MKKSTDIKCLVSPAPVSIISCGDFDGDSNLITCSWAGNVNSDPPMAYVCIRKERFSHDIVKDNGEFVINITTDNMLKEADLCGMYSGKNCNKWDLAHLTKEKASKVKAPLVLESPLSIECRVSQIIEMPTHDMFIGEVVAIEADESIIDEYGRVRPENLNILSWINKKYTPTGDVIGEMGLSVRTKSGKNRQKSVSK